MRIAILLAGWIWAVLAVAAASDVVVGLDPTVVLAGSGLILGLAWCGYSAARPSVFRHRGWRGPWLAVPALLVGVALLAQTDRVLVARIWLCEAELHDFVAAVRRGEPGGTPLRVGLFRIEHAEGRGDEVRLVTGGMILDTTGLAHRTTAPDPADRRHYDHLRGPWYRFWQPY